MPVILRRTFPVKDNPLFDNSGELFNNFITEQNLIYVSHVKHIDHATKI